MTRMPRFTPAALFASAGLAFTASANPPTSPQGGHVVAGSATINQTGHNTVVNNTNGTIINWNSFNIGAGSSVRFNQAGPHSRVLNRVTGGDATRIAGSLSSNGIVYVTNTAGIFIANGAVINVGGFMAAAGSISDSDFRSNINHFTNVTGTVENRGDISAQAAHLVGQRVANYGVINAPNGMVTMSAGSDVYIGEQGGQVFARISGAPANGGTGVTQAGEINARGGQVRLGAGDMYAVAIDHPGRTTAKKITLQGGRGSADPNTGVVSVSGTLDASDYSAGGHGGTIQVLGDRVGVFGAGHIDASGDAGGGSVMIGGNRQGQGPETNAQATYISKDAHIEANAVTTGDGGSVVVWSDGVTRVHGDISVHGGSQSGNGGFVETSGKHFLEIAETPDITAPRGRGGFWLIDPDDLTIVAGNGNVNVNQVGNVFTSSGAGAMLGVNLVTAALGGGSTVELRTGASANALGGTITLMTGVDLDFNGVGNATLSLFADRRIVIDGRILDSVAGGDSLNLNLTADNDMNLTGNILINNTISLGGGDFTVLRGVDFFSTAAITTGGGDFTITLANTSRKASIGANIDAGTGSIVLNPDVILTANVSLTAGNVTFARRVDSDGTARALDINLTGAGFTRFLGSVGAASALASIDVSSTGNAGTTRISGTSVRTTGDQTYNDDVILANDVVLNAANLTFGRTIDSDATARTLDIHLGNGGILRLFGDVGAVSELASFSVDSANNLGTARIASSEINTTGEQLYNLDVALINDLTINGGDITFAREVDSAAAARDLTVNTSGGGETKFLGDVGSTNALADLTTNTDGRTRISGGTIRAARVFLNDDVVLGSNTTITGNTLVDFARSIVSENGETNDLTVISPLTTFRGVVGSGPGLGLGLLKTDSAGTTNFNGARIFASTIDFGDKVVIGTDTMWTATNSIVFRNTVNSQAGENNDLFLHGPVVNFNGQVGNAAANTRLGRLTVEGGTTTLNTGLMKATEFAWSSNVILAFNVTLDATQFCAFAGTVNSRSGQLRSLTVNAATSTTFAGAIGGATGGALGGLTTDTAGSTAITGGSIRAGTIHFGDAVLIGSDTTITGTTSITFDSTINSSTGLANNLTLNSPITVFGDDVGMGPLGALGDLITDAAGTTTINAGHIMAENVEFRDAVLIGEDLTITGTTAIAFGSTLNSQAGDGNDLTLNTPMLTFTGIVGGATGGALGLVTTDADGTTTISESFTAASVAFNDSVQIGETTGTGMITLTTTGDQNYNGAVTLAQDTTMEGNDITFGLSVDSALSVDHSLTVNSAAAGVTMFNGPVGGINPLLSLTTNADGSTIIAGGTINTSADQTFNDAVVLGLTTILSGNDITFGGTVDSDNTIARDLTVNTSGSGLTTFSGAIGLQRALGSLTTNADGMTHLDGNAVGAEGDIAFNDAVRLGSDVIIAGANVTFGAALDSDFNTRSLTVNTSNNGVTLFGGAVGAGGALANLTTNSDGTTRISGSSVRTAGDQAYNDAVRLGSTTVLTGNDVRFASTIDSNTSSAVGLTVNSVGNGITDFGGVVGGVNALQFLTTDASGTTRIGANITTTGGTQTYNDVVLVYRDAVLTDTGGTGFIFGNTLDSDMGNHALSLLLNTSQNGTLSSPNIGHISFARDVGGITAFFSLNLGGNRSTSASVATITAGINAGTVVPNFSLLINTISGFTMGRGQKFSILGDFTLNSGGVATLGDISTLGNMTVNWPQIVLQTRPSGFNLASSSGALIQVQDPSMDFIAGGSINFSVIPSTSGSGCQPSFSTPDGTNIGTTLEGYPQRSFGNLTEAMFHQGALVFDLTATGATNTNVATAIAGALPPETTGQVILETQMPAREQIRELSEVGLNARSPDMQQLASYLSGRALYDDAAANMGMNESVYTVTIDRLQPRAVTDTLEAYRAVFAPEGHSQVAAVSEALTAAWKDYSSQAGDKADAQGFRAFVEAVPAHAKALYYLDSLRDLLREVGQLGLAPAELRAVKRNILKAVQVPGMTSDQLESAIMTSNMGVAVAE